MKSRKHTIFKVYSLGGDSQDILILGKLESTHTDGKSFEMDFAAQAVFAKSSGDRPEAESYRVWAVRSTLEVILGRELTSVFPGQEGGSRGMIAGLCGAWP